MCDFLKGLEGGGGVDRVAFASPYILAVLHVNLSVYH